MEAIEEQIYPFYTRILPLEGILSLVLLAASYVFIISRQRRSKHSDHDYDYKFTEVPGALPFIGNLFGGPDNLNTALETWAEKYGKNTGIFECNLFGQRHVVLCNDETISILESKRPFKVTRFKSLAEVLKSVGADGVFSAEGEYWKKDRRLVAPVMNRKNVKDYMTFIKIVTARLLDKWEHGMMIAENNDNVVNISPDLMSANMDIIFLVLFAKDIDTLRVGDSGMVADLKYILQRAMTRLLSPVAYWNIPIVGQYLDGCAGKMNRIRRSVIEIIAAHEISSVGVQIGTETETGTGMNTNMSVKIEKHRSKSFLTKIIAQSKKKDSTEYLSTDRLMGNLLTIFSAGTETSAVTLTVCLYQIALDNTGLQEELASESHALPILFEKEEEEKQEEDAGTDTAGIADMDMDMDIDELSDRLPRLRSLIYEVLRIKGPTPFLGFENTESLEVCGKVQPPNTKFFTLAQYASTLESVLRSESESGSESGSASSNEGRSTARYGRAVTPRGQRDAPLCDFCPRRWLVIEDSDSGSGSSSIGNKHIDRTEQPESKAKSKSKAPQLGSISVIRPSFKTGFRPFGSGLRVCPGRDLAEVEIMIILSSILRKFEIVGLQEGHPPVKHVLRFTQTLDVDICLVLKPRKS